VRTELRSSGPPRESGQGGSMPIEPAKKIYETPIIKKDDHATSSPRKKSKQLKKEPEKEPGKVDIKI
jgi:hypothetical protein